MHMRLRTWLHKYASFHMDLYCNSFIFHWILFIFNHGHSRCGAYPSSQQVWGRKKPNRMYSHKWPLKTTKSMQDIMNQTSLHTHGAPAVSWVLLDSTWMWWGFIISLLVSRTKPASTSRKSPQHRSGLGTTCTFPWVLSPGLLALQEWYERAFESNK